jgi:hypothetical protein
MELNFEFVRYNQQETISFKIYGLSWELKNMINMMKDILQYVPYALLVGTVFLMILAGVLITVGYFRKAEKRTAKR